MAKSMFLKRLKKLITGKTYQEYKRQKLISRTKIDLRRIENVIRKCEQFHAANLDYVNTFLEKHILPKLSQEDIESPKQSKLLKKLNE